MTPSDGTMLDRIPGDRRGGSVTDRIELAIPARAELLQLARMTAGVVAARADLGLDDVENLRLGVEELCLSLVGPTGHAPGRLALTYDWDPATIEISCTLIADDVTTDVDVPAPPQTSAHAWERSVTDAERLRQELSSQILDALVDEHGETHTDGHPGAWLRLRRQTG